MILDFFISLLGILITIFFVIGIHEGCHFLAARLLGVKVLRFSIGFGKSIFRWYDKHGTEYVLALIPLGGYVKMLDENEVTVPAAEKHLAYNNQPLYKRFLIVAAGPFSNLLAAVALYWIIFIIGFKSFIPIIGNVDPHSIADAAGLKPQQEILAIDNHPTRGWTSVSIRLAMHVGNKDFTVLNVKNVITQKQTTHRLNLEKWQMNDLKPDPLSSLGIKPYYPSLPMVIGQIKSRSPAAMSPLKIGDEIIAVDKKPIKSWDELILLIDKSPEQELHFTIKRDGKIQRILVNTGYQHDILFHQHGFLGIAPKIHYPDHLLRNIQYSPLKASVYAVKEVIDLSYINLLFFGKLITNKLSLYSLGGPITIFQTAGSAFEYGVIPFLSFLAFLNVAIGIINFFPVPGLDGGHLLFQGIELLARRPLSLKVQILFYRLGFIFIIFILIQALANDILRLWS